VRDLSDPALAFVIAVGIERYEYGPLLTLPGAGAYAVRFANWTLGCGVPPERITLAATWLDEPDRLPDGVKQVEPTREKMQRVITELRHVHGELLLMYWCGHGVVNELGERALFTSDATLGNMLNIPVDGVLRFLGSRAVQGFADQIALIDACGNFVQELGYQERLPGISFPDGQPREVSQFSFLAADEGQTADYDMIEREGTFSKEVMPWLESNARSLPPDVEGLARDVGKVYREKKARDELRAHPVYWMIGGAGFGRIADGLIPGPGASAASAAEAGVTTSQLRRLRDRIAGIPILATPTGRAKVIAALDPGATATDAESASVREVVDRLLSGAQPEHSLTILSALAENEDERLAVRQAVTCWRRQLEVAPVLRALQTVTPQQRRDAFDYAIPAGVTPRPESVDEALEIAADCLAEAGEDRPLHRLVARLEHLTGTAIDGDWYGLAPDRLNALRTRAAAEPSGMASVVIDLWGTGVAGSPVDSSSEIEFQVRRPGGDWIKRTVPCDDGVEQAVIKILRTAHTDELGEFTLGFIVPRAAFDLLPEDWEYGDFFEDPEPIGRAYPTVLHCAERRRAPRSRDWWRQKTAAIKARLVTDPLPTLLWLEPAASTDPAQIRRLVREADDACLGLAFAPGAFCGDLKRDPLLAAVAGGAPFVIWSQDERDDWQTAKQRLDDLIARGQFDRLPERVKQLRANEPEGLGKGLRLIWDEPEWLPPFEQLAG
jgi:vWA-MoxR associated protein C-terminal domain/Caspase domain